MKSRCLMMLLTAITLFAALAMPLRLTAQDQQDHNHKLPHYKLTVVPTLGGTFSEAVGVSNRGSVSGYSTLSGDAVIHAFFGRRG